MENVFINVSTKNTLLSCYFPSHLSKENLKKMQNTQCLIHLNLKDRGCNLVNMLLMC